MTHDDFTGYRSIKVSPEFHFPNGWYDRLMRDVVVAEWVPTDKGDSLQLLVQVGKQYE